MSKNYLFVNTYDRTECVFIYTYSGSEKSCLNQINKKFCEFLSCGPDDVNNYYIFEFVGTESDWSDIKTNIIDNLIDNEVDYNNIKSVLNTLFDKTKFECIFDTEPTYEYDKETESVHSFTDIFNNSVEFDLNEIYFDL